MEKNNTYDYITVGIIVKNEAKNIGNTLKYLFQQSYPHDHFEIIIADGNSDDSTREIAETILRDSDIHYKIFNEKEIENHDGGYNYGHSFARNIIIDHSDKKAKYIAWIDGDCRANTDWLKNLWLAMSNAEPSIVGAGGRRIVEDTSEISKKELMLNYYFTSKIMSLGNPAFCDSNVIYMPSIAGYNSIYRKEILEKYRYSTVYPFNIDDIEINFRLIQDGYKFLHEKNAHIYHRIDPSIRTFLKQMANYGKGAMNTSKIHKKIARIYIPIGLLYLIYTVLLPIFIFVSHTYIGNMYIPLIPYIFVLLVSIFVFMENYKKTHSLISLHVLYIVFLHPLMYGWGVMKGASGK